MFLLAIFPTGTDQKQRPTRGLDPSALTVGSPWLRPQSCPTFGVRAWHNFQSTRKVWPIAQSYPPFQRDPRSNDDTKTNTTNSHVAKWVPLSASYLPCKSIQSISPLDSSPHRTTSCRDKDRQRFVVWRCKRPNHCNPRTLRMDAYLWGLLIFMACFKSTFTQVREFWKIKHGISTVVMWNWYVVNSWLRVRSIETTT